MLLQDSCAAWLCQGCCHLSGTGTQILFPSSGRRWCQVFFTISSLSGAFYHRSLLWLTSVQCPAHNLQLRVKEAASSKRVVDELLTSYGQPKGNTNSHAEAGEQRACSRICKFFSSLKWVDLDEVYPAGMGFLQPRARLEGTCLLICGENKIFLK